MTKDGLEDTADGTFHLNEGARAALKLTDAERIYRIRSARWIGYTKAKELLDKLEDLLTHPKRHRMPNLLIVGDTNNGKTMIINRFHQNHPADDNPEGDAIILPVLIIQSPPVPDENRFYNSILEAVSAPYRASDRVDKKQFQALKTLERVSLRMLIIDEIHNLIAGSLNKQRHFLNTIKYIGNELQVPIVGVGTQDAFVALQTDPQLSNRFEPAVLPRWEMGHEYLRLLASFERMLPLKRASNLTETTLALKLLSMSAGIIGELSALLTKAAVKAIEGSDEQINIKLLSSVKWLGPSERKLKKVKDV
jgi:type II secretory pathway predicted ATPase ExeA